MAQLMPLPLTVSCFSKIQIGFAFLVPADPGSPGKRAIRRVCVCVCVLSTLTALLRFRYLLLRSRYTIFCHARSSFVITCTCMSTDWKASTSECSFDCWVFRFQYLSSLFLKQFTVGTSTRLPRALLTCSVHAVSWFNFWDGWVIRAVD